MLATLQPHYMCDFDMTQSIGKRYRRQDEIGTPWCVTVDFDSLEDHAVTVRDRDTTEQVRVPVDELVAELDAALASLRPTSTAPTPELSAHPPPSSRLRASGDRADPARPLGSSRRFVLPIGRCPAGPTSAGHSERPGQEIHPHAARLRLRPRAPPAAHGA